MAIGDRCGPAALFAVACACEATLEVVKYCGAMCTVCVSAPAVCLWRLTALSVRVLECAEMCGAGETVRAGVWKFAFRFTPRHTHDAGAVPYTSRWTHDTRENAGFAPPTGSPL